MAEPAGDRFPFRLLVLTGAAFVSVSCEFLPTAVLPEIAAEFDVSESQVGFLVTLFAATVVLTTAPLTLVTRRLSRKWLIVVVLGGFALSNLFAAAAPTYEALAAARVLGGLAHGLFWAVASPYASLLVPRTQLARAISVVTAGGTLAFVFGVPAGAAIGLAVGWRMAFVVMASATVLFLALAAWLLPNVQHRTPPKTGEIPVPLHRDRSVVALVVVAVTVLLMGLGHNVLYTYIAPWSLTVGGVSESELGVVLLCYGAAGIIGLVVAGTLGDRHPRLVVNVMMAGMVIALVAMALVGHGVPPVVAGMILWSAGFAGLPALLQTRTLHGASARLRDLSGAINGTAFNVAIGGGALVGGLVLDTFGITALPWVAAFFVALGLVWTIATDGARIRAHPAEAHLG